MSRTNSRHQVQFAKPFMVPRLCSGLFERNADPLFCSPRHAAGNVASVRRHDQGEALRDSN